MLQPTRLSQKNFELHYDGEDIKSKLGMGVWCSISPQPIDYGTLDLRAFTVGVPAEQKDSPTPLINDDPIDARIDERVRSNDEIISLIRSRSTNVLHLDRTIKKSLTTENVGGHAVKKSQLFAAELSLPLGPLPNSVLTHKILQGSPFSQVSSPLSMSPPASNGYVSKYLPPTWDPQSDFCFPVAEMPVARFVPDNMELNHFSDIQHIADGSNANVFLAVLHQEQVVIKMIRDEVQKDPVAVHEFDMEHGILVRLSHPNVIKIIGAGRVPRRFVVLEYLANGSLNNILNRNISKPGFANRLFHRPSFGFYNLLKQAKALAGAMDYLHRKTCKGASIIHRGK